MLRLLSRQGERNFLFTRAQASGAFFAQSKRHGKHAHGVLQSCFRSIRVRVMRVDGPDQSCRRINLQRPSVVANPTAQSICLQFHSFDLPQFLVSLPV